MSKLILRPCLLLTETYLFFSLIIAAAERRFGHPQADHSEEVQRFGLRQLCGSDGQKKCGWVFLRMTNVVLWIHSWVRCNNDDNITSIDVNDNKLKKQKMIICSVVLIQAHYYNWLSDYFRNGPLTSISQSCFFPPLISFLVPQMQILYSHSKKVRRLWFSNDMKWLLFFSLFFLWHYYCIIIIKTHNLYGFLFLSSGEMNDIFVGLMGRRNSEPGECCSWHKSNVLSSPAGIQTERLWCSSHRPYTFMGISCYVLSHR